MLAVPRLSVELDRRVRVVSSRSVILSQQGSKVLYLKRSAARRIIGKVRRLPTKTVVRFRDLRAQPPNQL